MRFEIVPMPPFPMFKIMVAVWYTLKRKMG
nr:MAG TPA: hypothetical protein [Caudoviricetes sp.]